MAKADFAKGMITEEARFVHIAVHTDDAALSCILPHGDVTAVGQHGLLILIHGNHQLVAVELAHEMPVIKVTERVDQRLLVVGTLHHPEEGGQ